MSDNRPSLEMDEQAIEALCQILDRGGSKWNGELWSTILRRRLGNEYGGRRQSRIGRTQWMQRHYHVYLRAYPGDGAKKSAAHVALTWYGTKYSWESVRTNATRDNAKKSAEIWIDSILKVSHQAQPFPGKEPVLFNYQVLERAVASLAAEIPE